MNGFQNNQFMPGYQPNYRASQQRNYNPNLTNLNNNYFQNQNYSDTSNFLIVKDILKIWPIMDIIILLF